MPTTDRVRVRIRDQYGGMLHYVGLTMGGLSQRETAEYLLRKRIEADEVGANVLAMLEGRLEQAESEEGESNPRRV